MLQRRGIPRLAGGIMTYFGFLAVVILIGMVMWPAVHDQGENQADRWPAIRTMSSSCRRSTGCGKRVKRVPAPGS